MTTDADNPQIKTRRIFRNPLAFLLGIILFSVGFVFITPPDGVIFLPLIRLSMLFSICIITPIMVISGVLIYLRVWSFRSDDSEASTIAVVVTVALAIIWFFSAMYIFRTSHFDNALSQIDIRDRVTHNNHHYQALGIGSIDEFMEVNAIQYYVYVCDEWYLMCSEVFSAPREYIMEVGRDNFQANLAVDPETDSLVFSILDDEYIIAE